MAKGVYIGVSGQAKKVKQIYIGVGGQAKKVKKGYIGVGGQAKLFYVADPFDVDTKTFSFNSDACGGNNSIIVFSQHGGTNTIAFNTSLTSTSCNAFGVSDLTKCGASTTNFAYLGGGFNSVNMYAFNTGGTRSSLTSLTGTADTARVSTSFGNYGVFGCIALGQSSNHTNARYMNFYNSANNNAKSTYTLSTYRDGCSMCASSSYLYVIGGENNNTAIKTIDVFNTSLGLVGTYSVLPFGAAMSGSAVNSSGQVFIYGGCDAQIGTDRFKMYMITGTSSLTDITNAAIQGTGYLQIKKSWRNFGAGTGDYVLFAGGYVPQYDDGGVNVISVYKGGVFDNELDQNLSANFGSRVIYNDISSSFDSQCMSWKNYVFFINRSARTVYFKNNDL